MDSVATKQQDITPLQDQLERREANIGRRNRIADEFMSPGPHTHPGSSLMREHSTTRGRSIPGKRWLIITVRTLPLAPGERDKQDSVVDGLVGRERVPLQDIDHVLNEGVVLRPKVCLPPRRIGVEDGFRPSIRFRLACRSAAPPHPTMAAALTTAGATTRHDLKARRLPLLTRSVDESVNNGIGNVHSKPQKVGGRHHSFQNDTPFTFEDLLVSKLAIRAPLAPAMGNALRSCVVCGLFGGRGDQKCRCSSDLPGCSNSWTSESDSEGQCCSGSRRKPQNASLRSAGSSGSALTRPGSSAAGRAWLVACTWLNCCCCCCCCSPVSTAGEACRNGGIVG
jgi:hypothetical protein